MIEPLLAMTTVLPVAAAGWSLIITWLAGGGIGMFVLIFILLKLLGK